MRKTFFLTLDCGLHIVWPVLSGILVWQLVFGLLVTWIEQWPLGDGLYFTFITGLDHRSGDFVLGELVPFPGHLIGLSGTVLTGLNAAVAVEALQTTVASERSARPRN